MEIQEIVGKCFRSSSGEEYGTIRLAVKPCPTELEKDDVIAEDECGNIFLVREGSVFFWDHETSESIELATSIENFISGCVECEAVELDPDEVISVWVDPEFAEKHGLKNTD